MAEETKVEQTEQESPTVEEQSTGQVETGEQPGVEKTQVEAPQDKNWRAMREELESAKAELQRLKGEETTPLVNTRSEVTSAYLTPEENNMLSKEEVKAEIKFPELETRNLFSKAVVGEYREALDKYTLKKSMGLKAEIPSVYEIAKKVKVEYDSVVGTATRKAEESGAKKAQQAIEKKEATIETEGRSDRGKATSSEDLGKLRQASREGNMDAVAARLSRSGL